MSKRVRHSTLIKKLSKWQKVLKLSDWSIRIRFSDEKQMGPNNVALLVNCSHDENAAEILIHKYYYKENGYRTLFNIDTLIIHELIHIILNKKLDSFPKMILKNKKFHNFEEFICNHFAIIIYHVFHEKL